MTTRINILKEAQKISHLMKHRIFSNPINISMNELTVETKKEIIENYVFKKFIKSEILDYWDDYLIKQISKHKNFYPRLLTEIVTTNIISESNKSNYRRKVIEYFDNCELIWSDIFEKKLSHESKLLIYQLVFDKNKKWFSFEKNEAFEINYLKVYNKYVKKFNIEKVETPFINSVNETSGYITNGSIDYLNFYDNSIKDYLMFFLNKNIIDIVPFYLKANNLFKSPLNSRTFRQFTFSSFFNNKLDFTRIKDLIIKLVKKNLSEYTLNDLYILHGLGLFTKNIISIQEIEEHTVSLLKKYKIPKKKYTFFNSLNEVHILSKIMDYDISNDKLDEISNEIKKKFDDDDVDFDDLNLIIDFLNTHHTIDVINGYDNFISSIIDDNFDSSSLFDFYDLENIHSECEEISNYFDLSDCRIVTNIKDSIEDLKDDEDWNSYENLIEDLESIFWL